MGIVLMFAAGYVMGARAGGDTLDEVITPPRRSVTPMSSAGSLPRRGPMRRTRCAVWRQCSTAPITPP